MRGIWMKVGLGAAAGLLVVLALGCKKAAPVTVQRVVRSVPRVAVPSDFPDEPLPVETDDPNVGQGRRRVTRSPAAAPQAGPTQEQIAAIQGAAEAAQRLQDERLQRQQDAASQRQQIELNQIVERSVKETQRQQQEPRIQDAPTMDPGGAFPGAQPGQEAPRIQDAPGPETQPGQEPPRIQDAPGPQSAQPVQPPAPAVPSPAQPVQPQF